MTIDNSEEREHELIVQLAHKYQDVGKKTRQLRLGGTAVSLFLALCLVVMIAWLLYGGYQYVQEQHRMGEALTELKKELDATKADRDTLLKEATEKTTKAADAHVSQAIETFRTELNGTITSTREKIQEHFRNVTATITAEAARSASQSSNQAAEAARSASASKTAADASKEAATSASKEAAAAAQAATKATAAASAAGQSSTVANGAATAANQSANAANASATTANASATAANQSANAANQSANAASGSAATAAGAAASALQDAQKAQQASTAAIQACKATGAPNC